MKAISLVPLMLLAAATAGATEPRFDPETLAKVVAPFCDDQTIAILHVNIWRIDGDQLVDKVVQLTKLPRDKVANETAMARQNIAAFKEAGGKDLFIVVSLADSPHPGVFVVPLYPESKIDALQRLGPQFQAKGQAPRLHDALVFGDPRNVARVTKLQAKAPAGLAKALAAAGDTIVQAVLLPRAAPPPLIEQMLASLPKELGDVPSTVLTRDIQWVAAGVNLAPAFNVRLLVQSQDDKTAAALASLSARLFKQASDIPPVRALVPNLKQLLPALMPKVEGDRLVVTLEEPTLTLAAVLLPEMQKQRAQSGEMMHMNHLKQVALAMHMFHDAHNSFPPHASYDKNGKPLLSWRVHVLPYLDQDGLYQQFHLNEPWDSPHNRTLIARMPDVYGPPLNSRVPEGKTTLMAPVGNDTIFPDRTGGTRMQDIDRGTSNTILLVEVTAPHAVIWTKPEDLNVTPSDPRRGLVESGQGGIRAVFADGSFRRLPASTPPGELWEMFTRGGPRQGEGAVLSTAEGTRLFARPWLLAALIAVALAVAGWFLARRFRPSEVARAERNS